MTAPEKINKGKQNITADVFLDREGLFLNSLRLILNVLLQSLEVVFFSYTTHTYSFLDLFKHLQQLIPCIDTILFKHQATMEITTISANFNV